MVNKPSVHTDIHTYITLRTTALVCMRPQHRLVRMYVILMVIYICDYIFPPVRSPLVLLALLLGLAELTSDPRNMCFSSKHFDS